MNPRLSSSDASSLHALLASIVTAGLTGCSGKTQGIDSGDAERQPVPIVTADDADAAPDSVEPPGENAALVCRDGVPSRVRGLHPDYRVDSLAYYTGASSHARVPPEFALVEVAGEPCGSSSQHEACNAEVEHARAVSASWWHYDDFFSSSWTLLLATSVRGPSADVLNRVIDSWWTQPGRGAYVTRPLAAASAGDAGLPWPDAGADAGLDSGLSTGSAPLPPGDELPVVTIDYLDELLPFLGRIDTPNEAALIMFASGRPLLSCAMQREGDDYIAAGTWQIGDCPITTQAFTLRVTAEGDFSEVAVGEPDASSGCVGRRPDGLRAVDAVPTDDACAAWLAHTAHLEAAAVQAFALLEADLEALGAPASLLSRVRDAAEEETVHAALVGALARARGVRPAPVVVQRPERRSVLDIAIENAVEGCVRECWGALCAHWQARKAGAADVRAVWQGIARDETEHAQLSRDIARWLDERLDDGERQRVWQAQRAAIARLRRELDRDPAARLVVELGLPDRASALAQFDALERHVLRPAAASRHPAPSALSPAS
jgi:hypothetical protein